jgi:ABC-type Zn uptake system ZnuABC Zn-binding protein ZnuA
MMKKLITCITLIILIGGVIWSAETKLNIVTTTTDLKSIAESMGGDYVNVKSLCQGNQNPHFIQAKPVYITWARNADLWIRIGMELEIGYEEPIIDGSRNTKIRIGNNGHLDASENIIRLEIPTTQKIDRSMGDIHPLGNPHYWLDPYNGRVMAKNITERLKKLVADNAKQCRGIEKNYQAFIKKLDEAMFGVELVKEIGGDKLWEYELADKLDELITKINTERKTQDAQPLNLGGWSAKMNAHRNKKIITYHRSWTYFVNRFELVVAEELEPKPGIPPSPKHLTEVINKIKSEDIKVLLMENFYSPDAPEFVAKKTDISIVQTANSVSGEKPERSGVPTNVGNTSDYISMINNVVEKIDKAFNGK